MERLWGELPNDYFACVALSSLAYKGGFEI